MYWFERAATAALFVRWAIILVVFVEVLVWPLPLTKWIDGRTAGIVSVACLAIAIAFLLLEVLLLPFRCDVAQAAGHFVGHVLQPIALTGFIILLAHAVGWEQQPMAVGRLIYYYYVVQ